jgi:hypothetical protein
LKAGIQGDLNQSLYAPRTLVKKDDKEKSVGERIVSKTRMDEAKPGSILSRIKKNH